MQPKRYQELSVTMKILVVSLCMGLSFFFSKANGSGESSQLSRGYSSLSLTFFAKTICDVQNDMVCAMGVYQYPVKSATWSQVLLCGAILKVGKPLSWGLPGNAISVLHPSPSNRDDDNMHCFTKSFAKSQERNRLHLRIINFAFEKGRLTYLLE